MYFKKLIDKDSTIRFYITNKKDEGYGDFITEVSISKYVSYEIKTMLEYILGHECDKIFYLHSFGTRNDMLGKGYGRKMIQYLKERYKGSVLYLCVCPPWWGKLSTSALIKFYKSEGFILLDSNETKKYTSYPIMLIEL